MIFIQGQDRQDIIMSKGKQDKKGNNTPKSKHKYGTISQTTSDHVVLKWNDRKSHLTVPLSPASNVATFYLATGYTRYDDFCIQAQMDGDTLVVSDEVPMCKEIAEPDGAGLGGNCGICGALFPTAAEFIHHSPNRSAGGSGVRCRTPDADSKAPLQGRG